MHGRMHNKLIIQVDIILQLISVYATDIESHDSFHNDNYYDSYIALPSGHGRSKFHSYSTHVHAIAQICHGIHVHGLLLA